MTITKRESVKEIKEVKEQKSKIVLTGKYMKTCSGVFNDLRLVRRNQHRTNQV